jgi:hypothetical protein
MGDGERSVESKNDERRTRLQEASRGPSDRQVHIQHDAADHVLHDILPQVRKVVALGKVDPLQRREPERLVL